MLQRYESAIEECHQAIALDPTFGSCTTTSAPISSRWGGRRGAVPWLEKAIGAPRYANPEFAHFNVGRVYEHPGQWSQAADGYRAALARNRDHGLARQALRLLIAKQN
jgi:tetratricopeptide (TPR) repeat protein